VPTVLIATDADWVHDEVEAALVDDDTEVLRIRHGVEVRPAVAEAHPDLVVLDLQIGAMGGIAASLDLRLEESGGRLGHVPVLILLDRAADVHLARRAGAEGWLVKPLDAFRVRRAALDLLAGSTYQETTGMETVPPRAPDADGDGEP
jgi:DNA-binding NarL/FixJ family response regulator